MVFLCGDLHGRPDNVLKLNKKVKLTEEDTLVLLGDVGANYYGGSRDKQFKELLSQVPAKILCVRGNHEMRPSDLASYHIITWKGGKVWVEDEYPNLLFAVDGEIFELEGFQCLVLGGAYSVDKYYRLMCDWGWWANEQLSDLEKANIEHQIENKKIDVIFSHTCPYKYRPVEMFLAEVDQSTVDESMERWLDKIEEQVDYEAWYCGHWHTDKRIDKMHFLFKDWVLLERKENGNL